MENCNDLSILSRLMAYFGMLLVTIVELEIMGVDELVLPLTDELILILKYCLIDNWSKDCLLKRSLTLNGNNKKDND